MEADSGHGCLGLGAEWALSGHGTGGLRGSWQGSLQAGGGKGARCISALKITGLHNHRG